jgi:hypothetical protein
VTRSTRNSPMSVEDFEALLAQSSLGDAHTAYDHVDVDEADVARTIAASAIVSGPVVEPVPARLGAKEAAEQVRRQANRLTAWINQLESAFAAGGQLLAVFDESKVNTTAWYLSTTAGRDDILLLCATNTRSAESLDILRAARQARITTWAIAPRPARGIKPLADDLMEIDCRPDLMDLAHEAVFEVIGALLDGNILRLGLESDGELFPDIDTAVPAAGDLRSRASVQPAAATTDPLTFDPGRRHYELAARASFAPADLRLVDLDDNERSGRDTGGGRAREDVVPISLAPLTSEEPDGGLLIFAATRSAWFAEHIESDAGEIDWTSPADLGWRAAENAAPPVEGDYTYTASGLPRRVPQQNLVLGSPAPDAEERPLRIRRDAATIAAHTSGYFRGFRRGQQVGGSAVSGRPGRESASGRESSRDTSGSQDVQAARDRAG